METYVGMIYIVPFDWAPRDFQICSGQTLSIQQYQALFALISFTYGGDQRTNFKLPNLQGQVPLGYGTAPSGTQYPLAGVTGSEKTTIDVNHMPLHSHAATFTPTTGTQAVTIPATTGNLQVAVTVNATSNGATTGVPSSTANMLGNLGTSNKLYAGATTSNLVPLGGTSATVTGTPSTPASTVNVTTVTGGAVTNAGTGGSLPIDNRQPSLALNFIIAVNGLYPNRP